MRTRTVILEAFEDISTGLVGLGLQDLRNRDDNNAAHAGLLIAHDLIEHVNGTHNIGSIDDELEALGGIWWVRGQWDDLNRDGVGSAYTVHENIASDITRMFRDFFYGSHVNTTPPRTKACDADDDFKEIIECAMRDILDEIDEDDKGLAIRKRKEYLRVCVPRMRIGYRKCRDRFKGYSKPMANTLFWEIAEAVDPYAKHCEFEGQQFELVYGIDRNGRAFARCEEKYQEDY